MGKRAGIASGESRRNKREELKARFIVAIEAGAELTKTGIVSPRTYQVWLKDDAAFAAKVDAVLRARREARPVKKYKRKSRAKVYGRSVLDGLNGVDIYVKAVKLLGNRKLMADIREAAISELIIMMLSGEEPNASKAVATARDEFLPHARYLEGDEFE